MKKRTFNVLVILLIALILLTLWQFGLLEKSAKFMVIPMLGFYYLGQYTERKFNEN
jgi:hypothetical protein